MDHSLFSNSTFSKTFSNFAHEFCTEDNINQCLAYISQELSALGYPSIYSDTSSCPFAVNCDIVKFLNVTFDLLQKNQKYVQIKEDLETRNQSLSGDLNIYKKKFNQSNNSFEQLQRKYNSSLEQERQLKQKLDCLQGQLKSEKDEMRKALSNSQQLKLTFQHDMRKMENDLNQMKAKMNQLLTDKNSERKLANFSSSYMLQRNDGQRGKWKTGTVSNSRLEDMFNSVIAEQESNCKEISNELIECCSCLKFVQQEILHLISSLKIHKSDKETINSSDCPELLLNSSDSMQVSDEHFYAMFKISGKNIKNDFKEKFDLLKVSIEENSKYQSSNHEVNSCVKVSAEEDHKNKNVAECNGNVSDEEQIVLMEAKMSDNLALKKESMEKQRNEWEIEKEKLYCEKASLIEAAACLKKEKEAIVEQKLELIKLEMRNLQNNVCNSPEQGLCFIPATSVSSANFNSPFSNLPMKNTLPSWVQEKNEPENRWFSKSDNSLTVTATPKFDSSQIPSSKSADLVIPTKENLPKWVTNNSAAKEGCSININVTEISEQESQNESCNKSSPENNLNPKEVKHCLSAEQSLDALKMVAEDLEKKRSNLHLRIFIYQILSNDLHCLLLLMLDFVTFTIFIAILQYRMESQQLKYHELEF